MLRTIMAKTTNFRLLLAPVLGIAMLIAVPAGAQGPEPPRRRSVDHGTREDAAPRLREAPRQEELSGEDARRALRHRLEELNAERERLADALRAIDDGVGLEEAGQALRADDRLRLLRSWRELQGNRLRRGPMPDIEGSVPNTDQRGAIRPDHWPDHPDMAADGPRPGRLGDPAGDRHNRPADRDRGGAVPERLEALRSFIRETNPLLWAELERLRANNPERFERMLHEQAQRAASDRQGFEFALRLDRADRELRLLAGRLAERGSPLDDAERSVLRDRIAAGYEARMAILAHRLHHMEQRLSEARRQHMNMLESRDRIIDERLEEIERSLRSPRPDQDPGAPAPRGVSEEDDTAHRGADRDVPRGGRPDIARPPRRDRRGDGGQP
ncbi:MAG: hypothetical protein ACTS3F_14960 [Phycisphaerales bacterium]